MSEPTYTLRFSQTELRVIRAALLEYWGLLPAHNLSQRALEIRDRLEPYTRPHDPEIEARALQLERLKAETAADDAAADADGPCKECAGTGVSEGGPLGRSKCPQCDGDGYTS